MRRSAVLLSGFLLAAHLVAQSAAHLPPVVPAGRPAIGLALEGGGALGLAHIGIIEWMEEHHIPVDRLAGTSMGSLVGASYASGMTPEEMRATATGNPFQAVFALQSPYADLNFRRRQDRRELPQALSVGLRHGVHLRNALLADRGVNNFLATILADENTTQLDFDHLPIPFRCVATDLNSLAPIVFDHGPLPSAVRASISIPGVFPPVQAENGHMLVDGGIVDNLPADVVRRDLHADVVIAIHIEDSKLSASDTSSIAGVLNRAFSAGIALNVAQAMRSADLVVNIPLGSFSGTDYDKGEALVHAGYLAAEVDRDALLKYALDDQAWAAYKTDRNRRKLPHPGILQAVQVEGGDTDAQASVRNSLKPLMGKPILPASTNAALKPVTSAGGYEATYQIFRPQGSISASDGSPALSYKGTTAPNSKNSPSDAGHLQPDSGLLIHLQPSSLGPPFLLIGPELNATTSNPIHILMNFRLIDQNLGGYGSELRGTARVGTSSSISLEYYKLLSHRGYFVQPLGAASREPVYIWQNQKRVAERTLQRISSGVEVGRTLSNSAQVSALWRAENTHWSLVDGTGGGPFLNGGSQSGQLRFSLDHEQASALSPNGWRINASLGALYHAQQSVNAPMAHLTFSHMQTLGEKNLLGFSGDASTYFRANVAEPYRFTLGGPMHLSAASIDEYRSTDQYLTRAGYLRQLAALPTGLGQGLYGTIGYEAGEFWSPEQHATLREDGLVGLVGSTPLGLITFGASVGDAGHRKLFLTFGRLF
ncbi:patatin-like phospholipase family protein [Telmatobacter bradus]|uniref:patatin-like phospholipase family protein n=1 Tax=Telmatobacter bradus TaxID=474953 RepID=UPI003B4390CE